MNLSNNYQKWFGDFCKQSDIFLFKANIAIIKAGVPLLQTRVYLHPIIFEIFFSKNEQYLLFVICFKSKNFFKIFFFL